LNFSVNYDCSDNHNCGGSFVQFQDRTIGAPVQKEKTYCGTDLPSQFYSTGSGSGASVKIQLDSTVKNGLPEFRAKYLAEICSREYQDAHGLILSPNFPNFYPNSVDCVMQVMVPDIQVHLALFFAKFELESSQYCADDFVFIDQKEKYCGTHLPNPYFKNSNSLEIKFHSNDQVQG